MKKLTLIVAALALVMGFSQCKKDNLTPNDNRIQITLNANYGGDRTSFTPGTGSFAWTSGVTEYINVGGSASGYLGQLNNSAAKGTGTFTGDIGTPTNGETLYFFYLGNGDHAAATTLDFSNQSSGNVTDWHIAIGSQTYSTGLTDFTATLNMAMAIAYFDLQDFGEGSIYLNGDDVYSTATINYNAGTISGNSKGYINVGTAGSKYVALIPSVETETTLHFNSSSKTGEMTFLRGIKPASYYSNSGSALTVSASDGSGIPGTFSVSATKKVFFSKGNLQYQASTGTWRFAENQYDYVGDATYGNVYVNEVKSNNANIASDYTGWIDLFGWGTGNTPTQTSTTASDYSTFTDWGTNTISNSDGYSNWRTLTKDEWVWVLGPSYSATPGTNCRKPVTTGLTGTNNTEARWVRATVNNVKGIIVFPDVYNHPTGTATMTSPTYNGSSSYDKFIVNSDDNWDEMETAGAIFLPITGHRVETTVNWTIPGYGSSVISDVVFYHSSTEFTSNKSYAYKLYFQNTTLNPTHTNSPDVNKSYGIPTRLVRE